MSFDDGYGQEECGNAFDLIGQAEKGVGGKMILG